jgi:hypothetical protein
MYMYECRSLNYEKEKMLLLFYELCYPLTKIKKKEIFLCFITYTKNETFFRGKRIDKK